MTVSDRVEHDIGVREAAPIVTRITQPVLVKIDAPRIHCIFGNDVATADKRRRAAKLRRQERARTLDRLGFAQHRAVRATIRGQNRGPSR